MKTETLETIVGGIVITLILIFVGFGMMRSGVKQVEGYRVQAEFGSVGSLRQGADVRLGGIKIGNVQAMTLNPEDFRAVITMNVQAGVQLPIDSAARILSDGLLGDSYVSLDVGGDDNMIGPGGKVNYTQDAVDVIDLVSRVIFSGVKYEMQKQANP